MNEVELSVLTARKETRTWREALREVSGALITFTKHIIELEKTNATLLHEHREMRRWIEGLNNYADAEYEIRSSLLARIPDRLEM
jgi:hypothetical protein